MSRAFSPLSFLAGLLLTLAAVLGYSPGVPAQTLPESYTIVQRGDRYRVNISYPSVGNPVADAELAIWARDQATTFIKGVDAIPGPTTLPYELLITYETTASSPLSFSVVFTISAFMGGAHPEPGMATFVYALSDGRRLGYTDIFHNYSGLLQSISEYCHRALTEQLGGKTPAHMLESGTKPDILNFDLFALSREGLIIYFPPYQVAPYSEGYLTVTIPLERLRPFAPQLALWGLARSL